MPFPKQNRLSLRFERDSFRNQGSPFYGKFFTLIKNKSSENTAVPRFGILISSKLSKLAVKRNYLRRLFSSLITSHLSTIPASDYLILPKKESLTANIEDIKQDIDSVLSQLSK